MALRGSSALALLLASAAVAYSQESRPKALLIGAASGIGGDGTKGEAALKSLKKFIKEETGLDNEIVRKKDWRELADELVKKKLHIAAFQGDEYAWAKARSPELEPLALGINVDRYPVAYLVAKKGAAVTKAADLKGKAVEMASAAPSFLLSFLRKETGGEPKEFFSALKKVDNVEDALDDVVDGAVPAAVVERAALDAFRRRKPGRFKQIEPVAKSQPFPPVVLAYSPEGLGKSLRTSFTVGLLGSSKTERGRTMLTLFRLTRFELAPADFGKVVAATEKAYPPPAAGK